MKQAQFKLFYSWQSDRKDTKKYIDNALGKAEKKLRVNNVNILIDKDTKGVLGAPNIATTIFEKINNCDVFLADISIVGKMANGKNIINQNVIHELGYAIGKHGDQSVILLFDKATGDPKDLPFDLSHKRAAVFDSSQDNNEQLVIQLISILKSYAKSATLNQFTQELDELEKLFLELFGSMPYEKFIAIIGTLDGPILVLPPEHDDRIYQKIREVSNKQEQIAYLDDMSDKGILQMKISDKGVRKYTPAKLGFKIMKNFS